MTTIRRIDDKKEFEVIGIHTEDEFFSTTYSDQTGFLIWEDGWKWIRGYEVELVVNKNELKED